MATLDIEDKKNARLIVVALAVLVILGIIATALIVPAASAIVDAQFTPGIGLKSAAIISFVVTVALFIVFAIVSGDGLIGELQFLLAGFFCFFLICWLMVAWIF